MCVSCATTPRPAGFKTILYSFHAPGGAQQAVRSLESDGRVEGSHLSGGTPPVVSISSESATPDDLREIASLVEHLPRESAAEPMEGGYMELEVVFTDGSVRTWRATGPQWFADPVVHRLQQIMASYRAGYW